MFYVSANLCDGSDYTFHWDGGEFSSEEAAIRHWDGWMPPRDEVEREVAALIADGVDPDEIDLQVGVWDEDGNEVAFHSEFVGR